MAEKIRVWLSGYYTAKELEKITGKSGRSIRIVMIFHGATVEYKFNGKAIEGIYKWDGFK